MKVIISIAFAVVTSLSAIAQTPVDLKLKLEKKQIYKTKIVSTQNIQATYNGTPFTSEVFSSIFLSYKVLEQENETMTIEFRFDTIASKMSSPMGKVETNSAIAPKGKDPVERIMNKLSSLKLIAKLSTSGKFVGFVNYKTFRDSVMMVLDSVPATKKDMAQKQADGIVKESSLQSMIEPYFSYLPGKPVNVGEKWETTVSQVTPMVSVISFNSYTLTAIEANGAMVSGETEFETIPPSDPNAQMSIDLKGKNTITASIDIKTGLVIKYTSKGHSEGARTMKNQGNEVKMPMTIESTTEIFRVN